MTRVSYKPLADEETMLAFPFDCCTWCCDEGNFGVGSLDNDWSEDCVVAGSGVLQKMHVLASPAFKQKQIGHDSAELLATSSLTAFDSTGTLGFKGRVDAGVPK